MINLDKIINYFNCKKAFTYFFIKCLNDLCNTHCGKAMLSFTVWWKDSNFHTR